MIARFSPEQRLYKDRTRGWLFGVCAGLADYSNMSVTLIRFLFIVLFFATFSLSFVIYVLMALFLPDRVKALSQKLEEFRESIDLVDKKLQDLERDILYLEDYMTSSQFEFQKAIWNLHKSG